MQVTPDALDRNMALFLIRNVVYSGFHSLSSPNNSLLPLRGSEVIRERVTTSVTGPMLFINQTTVSFERQGPINSRRAIFNVS